MSRITVLGSGAWGTALAISLARKPDNEVTLWSHRPEAAEALNRDRENVTFLPGFPLLGQIHITGDDKTAVRGTETLIFAVPSQHLRSTAARVGRYIMPGGMVVSATKGIEDGSFLRMTEVLQQSLYQQCQEDSYYIHFGALSGPSFAQEVAAGMPTAVTVAFEDPEVAAEIQKQFSSETLRLYTNDDLIGVEMGGALKNVIAIAAGIAAGQGLGLNSAAGLITRGIAEMTRLAVAAGGQRETLSGLSGVGDRTVGFELGRGRKLPEILASLDGKVAEGVRTTRAALGLARKLGVEMPITEQMQQILDHGKDPKAAIRDLMLRPGRDE
jgi:glycerol-3-phosphate dehydrogenase (NAD(P)+)